MIPNENKSFLVFCSFFKGFQFNFLTQYQKPQILYTTKVLSQEDSKVNGLFCRVKKMALFFTSKAIVLQSMWSKVLKKIPHIILVD
jgi:hypothetical protein